MIGTMIPPLADYDWSNDSPQPINECPNDFLQTIYDLTYWFFPGQLMIGTMIAPWQIMIDPMIPPRQFMIDPLIFSWAINDCPNHFPARQLIIGTMILPLADYDWSNDSPQAINDCPNDFLQTIYDWPIDFFLGN